MLNRELQPGPLRLGRPDQSARARILNQPSTAMLAQANQGPADLLCLLRQTSLPGGMVAHCLSAQADASGNETGGPMGLACGKCRCHTEAWQSPPELKA